MENLLSTTLIVLTTTLLQAQKPALQDVWYQKHPDLWLQFTELRPFSETRMIANFMGNWFLLDENLQKLTPKPYRSMDGSQMQFPEQLVVQNEAGNSKLGLINSDGQEIVPCEFSHLKRLENGNFRGFTFDNKARDYDPQGKEVTPPILKNHFSQADWSANQPSGRLFSASDDGVFFGLMDENENWLLRPEYLNLNPTFGDWWLADMGSHAKKPIRPDNLKLDLPFFENVITFENGHFWGLKDYFWTEYDQNGKKLNTLEYDPSILELQHGGHFIVVSQGLKKGLVNELGELVLPVKYEEIQCFLHKNKKIGFSVKEHYGKIGFFDGKKWQIEPEYFYINYDPEREFFTATGNDKTDIFNSQFQKTTTLPFQGYWENNGCFMPDNVQKNQFWTPEHGLILLKEPIQHFDFGGQTIRTKSPNNKRTIYDAKGNVCLKDYDNITAWGIGSGVWGSKIYYYILQKGNYFGLSDHTFQHQVPCIYEDIKSLGLGYFLAQKNMLWGVINYKGEVILPFEHEAAKNDNPYFSLKKDGFWALFSIENPKTPFSAFEFEEIQTWSNYSFRHTAAVRKDGNWYLYYLRKRAFGAGPFNGQIIAESYRYFKASHADTQFVNSSIPQQQNTQILNSSNPQFLNSSVPQPLNRSIPQQLFALFTEDGRQLTEHLYTSISLSYMFDNYKYAWMADLPDGSKVYLDHKGKEILRVEKQETNYRHKRHYSMQIGGKCYLFDASLKKISEKPYEQITFLSYYSPYLALCKTSEKQYEIVDARGNVAHEFAADTFYFYEKNQKLDILVAHNGERYLLNTLDFSKKPALFDRIDYSKPVYFTEKDGKKGALDAHSREIVPCIYDESRQFSTFRGGPMEFIKDGLSTVFDQNGKVILAEGKQASIMQFGEKEKQVWAAKQNGKYFLFDPKTGKRHENDYTDLQNFWVNKENFLIYDRNGKKGLMDLNFVELTEPRFTYLYHGGGDYLHLTENNGSNSKKTFLYDLKKREFTGETHEEMVFHHFINLKDGDLFTVLDKDRKPIFTFRGHELVYWYSMGGKYFYARNSEGVQLLNTQGKNETGKIYDEVRTQEDISCYFFQKGRFYGIGDWLGREITPLHFDEIKYLYDSKIITVRKDGLWGACNHEGKVLLPVQFEEISASGKGFVIAKSGGKYQFFSPFDGKLLFDGSFDYADVFVDGLAAVCQNHRWGYLDAKGKMAIPMEFDFADRFRSGQPMQACVFKNGQAFAISESGRALKDGYIPEYLVNNHFNAIMFSTKEEQKQLWSEHQQGIFQVVQDGRTGLYGCVNYRGKLVLPAEYTSIRHAYGMRQKCLIVEKNGVFGMTDLEGRLVLPLEYENLGFENSEAYGGGLRIKAKKGGREFWVDASGKILETD